MYYVPDGTEQCGYYECKECGSRFLDLNCTNIGMSILWRRSRYGDRT